MSNEPRKATDVLLELESKIDSLIALVRSQDLNIKLLSNKLNMLINNKQVMTSSLPSIEAVDTEHFPMVPEPPVQIPINSESKILIEKNPQGFRRTSRPETYSGDNSYLSNKKVEPKFPVQVPKAEVIVPEEATAVKTPSPTQVSTHDINTVPVQQRVVDKNSKSVFLADVEIFNQNDEKLTKTRTNGAGKWMASLSPGTYRVILTKREALTKEKVSISQDVFIDGKTTPLELPMLIFK